jgi:hypothetical protein
MVPMVDEQQYMGVREQHGALEWVLKKYRYQYLGVRNQHGNMRQIPKKYSHLPVVTVTRDPIARYISIFRYRWWVENPPGNLSDIRRVYPKFPDLSFTEFYDMLHTFGRPNRPENMPFKKDLGISTIRFIQFYFNNPDHILNNIDDDYIERRRYEDELKNITFLHQENLNAELRYYLLEMGYSERDLDFLKSKAKVNVTENLRGDPEIEITDEIVGKILERDSLLFSIFPEYLRD